MPWGPWWPVAPVAPVAPAAPVAPRGTVKFKTAAEVVPEFVTEAFVPAAPVVVVPTETLAAVPAGPVAPVAPMGPAGPRIGPTLLQEDPLHTYPSPVAVTT